MSEIDDEALEWVARQAAREPEEGERAAFDAWYAADAIARPFTRAQRPSQLCVLIFTHLTIINIRSDLPINDIILCI